MKPANSTLIWTPAVFFLGVLLGLASFSLLPSNAVSSESIHKEEVAKLSYEAMLLAKQYREHRREHGEWPEPESVVTLHGEFVNSETDSLGWRVDRFRVSGSPPRIVRIATEPDGNSMAFEIPSVP